MNGGKKGWKEIDSSNGSGKQSGGNQQNPFTNTTRLSSLSKQPLRVCEKSNSLISDAIGVSFPIVDGIPCLVPKDGKIIEQDDTKGDHQEDTSS